MAKIYVTAKLLVILVNIKYCFFDGPAKFSVSYCIKYYRFLPIDQKTKNPIEKRSQYSIMKKIKIILNEEDFLK